MIVTTLLTILVIGCGQSRFEFLVTDEEDRPLEGVLIYYETSDGSRDTVGRTNAEGSLLVTGKHLATPRSYRFSSSGGGGGSRQVFDPSRCALLALSTAGGYTFRARDGLVRSPDLDRDLPGKNWPGRRIELQRAGAGSVPLDASSAEVQQILRRTLDLTGPAGAEVEVNGRFVGRVPENGRLLREFCPGDSEACFAASMDVVVRKPGFAAFARQAPLPPAGETVFVDAPLTAVATDAGGDVGGAATDVGGSGADPVPGGQSGADAGSEDSAAGLAWVRFENHGYPLTCGAEGTAWPRVLINDERQPVSASAASTQWKAYYDVLLQPGVSYCVAVHCHREGASEESWNPWDPGSGGASWYRLRISTGAERVFFTIPRYEEGKGLTLRPQSGGTWEGFQVAGAPRITGGCTR